MIAAITFVLSNLLKISYLYALFTLSGAMTWILIFYQLKGKVVERIARHSESVFFVLALHNIIVLANVGKVLDKVLSGHSCDISYWIAPFITLVICMGLYYLLKQMLPRTAKVLCGGR